MYIYTLHFLNLQNQSSMYINNTALAEKNV